jgi:transcription termination/antitermination protein NusA
MQSGYNSLMALPGVGISLADALYEKGFYSAEEIGKSSVADLLQIRGIDEQLAASLIEAAQIQVEKEAAEMAEAEAAEAAEAAAEAEAPVSEAGTAPEDASGAEAAPAEAPDGAPSEPVGQPENEA